MVPASGPCLHTFKLSDIMLQPASHIVKAQADVDVLEVA